MLDKLNLNSIQKGLVQPADDAYNNTDTFYWDKNPLDFGDGSKEVKEGAIANKNANVKFKFLL